MAKPLPFPKHPLKPKGPKPPKGTKPKGPKPPKKGPAPKAPVKH